MPALFDEHCTAAVLFANRFLCASQAQLKYQQLSGLFLTNLSHT